MDTIKSHWKALKRRNNKVVTLFKSDKTTLEIGVVFKEYNNGNNSIDDKIIFADIELLHQGDIIEYNSIKYIIIQEQETFNNIYTQFVCRRLDNSIKIYVDNILEEIPTYIETSQQGMFQNNVIKTGEGNLKLTTQDNNISNKIIEDMRIIKWGYGWDVIAKTQENEGLRYIYLEKTQVNKTTDDVENEIADYWKHNIKHNYSMELDTTDISLNKGDTKQLTPIIKDTYKDLETKESKIVIVENPTIIYTSQNDKIATVDDNGKFEGINEGSTTICVQFKDIIKTINISVNKKEISLIITGEELIFTNSSENYTCNGVGKCTWSITDENNKETDLATVKTIGIRSCSVKVKDSKGNIILNCTDSKGNKGNKSITLDSCW